MFTKTLTIKEISNMSTNELRHLAKEFAIENSEKLERPELVQRLLLLGK
ncbi:MAG: hypothetical protein M9899_03180 [Bdellovibrionaceae bacterium]|nr:hypothetical protein [Pseudobdellovibrionaceae bacterium]